MVFIHGYQGNSLDLAVIKGHLVMTYPNLECYSSKANEVRKNLFAVIYKDQGTDRYAVLNTMYIYIGIESKRVLSSTKSLFIQYLSFPLLSPSPLSR